VAISDLSIDESLTVGDTVTNESVCDSSVRGKPSACVFVASLSSVKTDDELSISVTKHFQQWGKLGTVKVLRDTYNRPYAFVQYSNDSDCKTAIEKGHNSSLDGRTIRCEAAKVNRTLFVQTPKIVLETLVRNQLIRFGEIEHLVPCNRVGVTNHSSSSKFWYCKFAFRDDAIKAFASLTEENKFEVDWTQNIDENQIVNERKIDKFSVFVGQLSSDVDEADLRKRFERHGKIERINIFRKEKSSFAFIRFGTESGAAGAVERENHSMFNGKTIHIQYREIQVPSKFITNPFGVPLAPPPISLNRKVKHEQPRFRGLAKYNRGFSIGKPHDGSLMEQDINVENRIPGSRDLKPSWDYLRRKDQFYESGRRDKFCFSKRYNKYGPRYDPFVGSNYFYVPRELNEENRSARFATRYYQPYYLPPYYDPNSIDET
jgi:RNA recognition motif-containing protein